MGKEILAVRAVGYVVVGSFLRQFNLMEMGPRIFERRQTETSSMEFELGVLTFEGSGRKRSPEVT